MLLIVPFLASAAVLAALTLAVAWARDLLAGTPAPRKTALPALGPAMRDPRLIAGAAAMFANVGAQVTIGTMLTNYLVLPATIGGGAGAGAAAARAGRGALAHTIGLAGSLALPGLCYLGIGAVALACRGAPARRSAA